MVLKMFYKIQREEALENSIYKTDITMIPMLDRDTTKKKAIG
jgi:hypothetical protein